MVYYMVAGRGVNSLVERLVQKFTLAHSTLSRNPSAHDQRTHGTPRSGVQRDVVFDPRIKELSSVFFVKLSLTQHNRPKGILCANKEAINRITTRSGSGTKVLQVVSSSSTSQDNSDGSCESCGRSSR